MATAWRDLALDTDGDLLIEAGDFRLLQGNGAIVQECKTALGLWTGEYPFDLTVGTAWPTLLNVKGVKDSQITAEVKVDETDIVNLRLGQPAEITIDAISGKTFAGHVVEIGNSAILRSSGLAASQSNTSSQEAKDFKVVVALDNPPDEIRPGLSCSTKITVAVRKDVLSLPLQALTVRTKGDLEDAARERDKNRPKEDTNKAIDPAVEKARKEEIQGVFVVNGERAEFRKVETGITGATDIEVLVGLKPGDEVVTGSYKAIRSMKDGARIKVDNRTPSANDSKS